MANNVLNPKYLESIKKFTLLDDTFARKVFEDNIPAAELLLRIILKNDKLRVDEVLTQKELNNLAGHGSIMDILATDDEGKKYNVEVQRNDEGAIPRRARYYSSLLDSNSFDKGEEYEKLPETYVIFITENDVMKGNEPTYEFVRMEMKSKKHFNDGSHIIYVNNKIQDDTALGRLMSDFTKTNPRDMYYKVIAEKAAYFKESGKGVAKMCKVMEELMKQEKAEAFANGEAQGEARGREQGRAEGKAEGRTEGIAIFMMRKSNPLQEIIDETKLDKQVLQNLAKENNIEYNFAG